MGTISFKEARGAIIPRARRSVLEYGTNAAGFQSAFDAMSAGDFDLLEIPSGEYTLNTEITTQIREGTGVVASGAVFKSTGANERLFQLSGPGEVAQTSLSVDASEGDHWIDVADASGIQENDILEITSDEYYSTTEEVNTIEVQVVRAVSGARVYLDAPLLHDFTGQASLEDGGDGVITVTVNRPVRNIFWSGGRFELENDTSDAVLFRHINGLMVSGAIFNDSKRNSLRITRCANDLIFNCGFYNSGTVEPEGGYGGDSEFGYGVIHARSCYSNVAYCRGGRGWHTFEAAYGVRDIKYSQCQGYSDAYAFSTHEGCARATYEYCTSEGKNAITNRAREIHIVGGHYCSPGQVIGMTNSRPRRVFVKDALMETRGDAVALLYYGVSGYESKFDDQLFLFKNNTFIGSGRVDIGVSGAEIVNIGNSFLRGATENDRST